MNDKKNYSIQDNKSEFEQDQTQTSPSRYEKITKPEHTMGEQYKVFQRNYSVDTTPSKSKKASEFWKKYKTLILSGLTAVIIGSFLGIVMLFIFVDLDPEEVQFDQQATSSEVVTSNTDGAKNTDAVQTEYQTANWQFFVIQAGVYSNQETANQLIQSLKKENINGMIWKQEELYHVFMGLHSSHQQSKQFATEAVANNREIYAGKAWSTNSHSVNLSKEEKNWLSKAETEIERLIQNPSNRSALEELIQDAPANLSASLQDLNAQLEKYLAIDNKQHLQVELLKVIKQYDNLSIE